MLNPYRLFLVFTTSYLSPLVKILIPPDYCHVVCRWVYLWRWSGGYNAIFSLVLG